MAIIMFTNNICLFKDPLLTMILCAPNEKQDKGNLGQKDVQIIRKLTLAPRRIMVSKFTMTAGGNPINKAKD